jgi:hypothetical protein
MGHLVLDWILTFFADGRHKVTDEHAIGEAVGGELTGAAVVVGDKVRHEY